MPDISLQSYGNEIDQLIEQARYLEAVAHVRHILVQYPRYAGAYYLLGKTLLEVDLPELAADVFRRALSADPEHLTSRIGLGLAHERANNLDASIWNLLRALELDPGNNEISDELRRMYGQRDGREPDYIKLTPAGLARLLIRGGRYTRAVTLLRGLLEEEPARPDLMTALAEASWRDEQIVHASDLCQDILDKMPYNCKANLLLGSLWVNSGQEEGWTYLQRAEEVDPQNAMAGELFGSESLLEPQTVTLDRLVYDPDAIDVDQESAWFKRLEAASVSAGISEATAEMTESEMRLVDITAGLESQIEIPDWLRELGGPEGEEEAGGLGWMADAGVEVEEEAPEEAPVAEADLDDTLATQAPFDEDELLEEVEEEPDWLQELTAQDGAFDVEEAGSAPDWLMELVEEEGGEEEAAATVEALLTEDVEEEAVAAEEASAGEEADWLVTLEADADEGIAPDWLQALEPEKPAAEAEGIPDWIAELAPEGAAEDTEVVAEAQEEVAELEEVQPPESVAETAPEEPVEAPEAEGAVPDWLVDFTPAEEDLVEAGEPLVPTVAATDEAPITTALEEGQISEAAPWAEEEAEPADAAQTVVEATPDTSLEEGLMGAAALSWLDQLTAEADQAEPPPVTAEPEASEAQATVVADEEVAETGAPPDEVELPASAEAELEVAEATAPPFGEADELMSGDDALAWLESLAAGKEDELRAQAEADSEARVAELLGRPPAMPEAEVEAAPVPGEPESLAAADQEVAEPEVALEAVAPSEALAEGETRIAEPEAIEEEAEPDAAVTPTPEGDLLAGDDALAWLEGLAVGKEDELQPQAEAEAAVEEGVPEADAGAAELTVDQPAATVIEVPEAEEAGVAPTAEGDLLSGDDALAWLQSLTVGKEEDLRAQAEAEAEARVDEILGRRRPAPEAAPEVIEEAPELAMDKEVEPAEPEIEAELEVTEDVSVEAELEVESADLGYSTPVEEITEEAPAAEETEAAVPKSEEEPEVEEAALEPDLAMEAGEDALTWLSELPPEKAAELEAQMASGEEGRPEYFGWSSFEGQPTEVAPPAGAMEQEAAEPTSALEPVALSEPTEEQGPAVSEPSLPEAQVEEAEPEIEAAEPDREKAELEGEVAESVAEEAEPEVEATVAATDVEEPVAEEPEPEEEPSEEEPVDPLDEMRAYTKRKRSDHDARLKLARALWEAGEIQESMEHYGRLIKSNARSDDVMADLNEYIRVGPSSATVMRALGDAYMKKGELEKALDIYNRAMNML